MTSPLELVTMAMMPHGCFIFFSVSVMGSPEIRGGERGSGQKLLCVPQIIQAHEDAPRLSTHKHPLAPSQCEIVAGNLVYITRFGEVVFKPNPRSVCRFPEAHLPPSRSADGTFGPHLSWPDAPHAWQCQSSEPEPSAEQVPLPNLFGWVHFGCAWAERLPESQPGAGLVWGMRRPCSTGLWPSRFSAIASQSTWSVSSNPVCAWATIRAARTTSAKRYAPFCETVSSARTGVVPMQPARLRISSEKSSAIASLASPVRTSD